MWSENWVLNPHKTVSDVDEHTLRLWSLHPSYLDSKGLNAVWREGLLAQAVLLGRTTAWKKHSQLLRFQNHGEPISAIGFYLLKIHEEANNRGYNYTRIKISNPSKNIKPMDVTKGQLLFESTILMERLRTRDSRKYEELFDLNRREIIPKPHPLFALTEGDVEHWEKSYQKNKTKPIAFTQQ